MRKKRGYRLLRRLRAAGQLFFLGLFFYLFIQTDYHGSDQLEYAVNLLFRIDPLLAASTMLGIRAFIALMAPALIIVALSLLLGRSFCGWVCPLGSMLDGARPLFGKHREKPTIFPRLALLILVLVLTAAAFRLPLAGYVDPFSILLRGLVTGIYPAFNELTVGFFTFTYQSAPDAVNLVSEPVYGWLRESILPFQQKYFTLVLVSVLVLAAVFLLEMVQRRFFCRNLCPLGAMLGLFSRIGATGLHGGSDACGGCHHCAEICRMGAIEPDRLIDPARCNLCLDCLEQCPRQVIGFRSNLAVGGRSTATLPSRRQFLTVLGAGAILPAFLGVRTLEARGNPAVIRPPGALAEPEFLQHCVRCAECIQVCIGNALQPAFLEAGIEGLFTPLLAARTGYCEFNCTLCGQVCPTGALQLLSKEEKQITKIGNAWLDRDRCLPYNKAIPCIVCEEHCPTPDKAIKFNEVQVLGADGLPVTVKQPYIVDELCIGCGICETRCPLPGRSAIVITSAGEVRDPDNRLPAAGGGAGYSGLPY